MASKFPLVSIICLCYNHAKFVEEAIYSALNQDYPNVELIIYDDASSDGSQEIIRQVGEKIDSQIRPFHLIFNDKNKGNCKAFNEALQYASGEYLIDLATDDIILPSRVSKGVKALQQLPDDFGVTFCNAGIIDEKGNLIGYHFPIGRNDQIKKHIPEGNIYKDIIRSSFISPPTIMFKRAVIDWLGGYDERLTYEDFDFWVRSARHFQYNFIPELLVYKRNVKGSLMDAQLRRYKNTPIESPLYSTYLVCEKAFNLNKKKDEFEALAERIKKEMRQCLYLRNYYVYKKFKNLLFKTGFPGFEGNIYNLGERIFGLTTLSKMVTYIKNAKNLKKIKN